MGRYIEVGESWEVLDGFSGLGASTIQAAPARRTAIPVGSMVPTLLARRPSREIGLGTREGTVIVSARRNMIRKLRSAARLPTAKLAPVAKVLKTFGALQGFGAGSSDVDQTRAYTGALADAMEEIDSLGMRANDVQRLGNLLTAQRAGEIGAALGLDVTWGDLLDNCGSEFARIRTDLQGVMPPNILSTVGFERISAVFRDQGQNVESLRRLATSARGLYESFGPEAITQVVRDATAFGEGGMRQLLEGAIGDGASKWLTGENLQRLGSVASAWVGAGQSGSAMAYVSAAAGTLSVVGVALGAASVAVPVGTIIAAAGALITLIATLVLGDEAPEPPPVIKPCVDPAHPEIWMYNPEAWTAVAMWLIAKDNKYFDSDLFREVENRMKAGSPILAQQLLANDFNITIDRYTGEVMVQETPSGVATGTSVRLLDYIDRDVLMPPEEPTRAIDIFSRPEMRAALGLVPKSPSVVSGANYLWCAPHPLETQTRFLGADRYRSSHTYPFRRSVTATPVPGHLPWGSWLGREHFWKSYPASLVMSVYLAGTVPFGVRGGLSRGFAISTGVGGSPDRIPIDVVARHRAPPSTARRGAPVTDSWEDRYTSATGMLLSNFDDNPEVEVSFADFRTLMQDESFRKMMRIPDPSPEVQATPETTVKRSQGLRCSASGICPAPRSLQMRMMPNVVFKRGERGLSRNWKIGLTVAGGLVLAGGGTLVYRHWRRNR